MSGHALGRVTRDSDGDLLAICSCGARDCPEPWATVEAVSAHVRR